MSRRPAKPEVVLSEAQTALIDAIRQGNLSACKKAYQAGALFTVQPPFGDYPLAQAVRVRNIKICEWMLDMGADIRIAQGKYSTLHHAIDVEELEIARMLIERGANVEAEPYSGWRPLHLAAMNGQTACCRLLLEEGADIHACRNSVSTPLMFAARNGMLETCEFLLSAGANPLIGGNDGKTVLHGAAAAGKLAVCELLVSKGVKVEVADEIEFTALHCAVSGGDVAVCRLLVEAGAHPSYAPAHASDSYLTPFQHAVAISQIQIIRYFVLECGEDPAQRTRLGKTMIQLAPGKEPRDVIRALRTELAVAGAVVLPSAASESAAKRSHSTGPL